jgi:threonine dehydratase
MPVYTMTTDTRPTGWGDPPALAPTLDDIRAAARRLKRTIVRTPLLQAGPNIWLKPESLQPTGSFKVRGVGNWAAGLSPAMRRRGFSTFSAGNTALALAWFARRFDVSCRSILPDYAPEIKVRALRECGVETVLVPFDELADYIFRAGWRSEPYAFLHPWTEPAMIAGHATIGLEIIEDLPDVETVFVPVGGGALIGGVASAVRALKPSVRVVGVQTESYPSLAAGLAAGKPVWVKPKPTICDGVAVPFVTDQMFPLLRQAVDEALVVPEARVRAAIGRLATDYKLVSEGAGALALAAALDLPLARRGRAVCLVTGGNVPPREFAAGLAFAGSISQP